MSAAQAAKKPEQNGRDALGWFCFVLHLAIVGYAVVGWLTPWRGGLIFYLCYVPLLPVQWQLNRTSCILNNIETWLRTGRWRNPSNPEEGAFLLKLVERVLGLHPSRGQMDAIIYSLLGVFWLLALSHLYFWL
jgi:hypothetical protein